jgi:hypothetical protein
VICVKLLRSVLVNEIVATEIDDASINQLPTLTNSFQIPSD